MKANVLLTSNRNSDHLSRTFIHFLASSFIKHPNGIEMNRILWLLSMEIDVLLFHIKKQSCICFFPRNRYVSQTLINITYTIPKYFIFAGVNQVTCTVMCVKFRSLFLCTFCHALSL